MLYTLSAKNSLWKKKKNKKTKTKKTLKTSVHNERAAKLTWLILMSPVRRWGQFSPCLHRGIYRRCHDHHSLKGPQWPNHWDHLHWYRAVQQGRSQTSPAHFQPLSTRLEGQTSSRYSDGGKRTRVSIFFASWTVFNRAGKHLPILIRCKCTLSRACLRLCTWAQIWEWGLWRHLCPLSWRKRLLQSMPQSELQWHNCKRWKYVLLTEVGGLCAQPELHGPAQCWGWSPCSCHLLSPLTLDLGAYTSGPQQL